MLKTHLISGLASLALFALFAGVAGFTLLQDRTDRSRSDDLAEAVHMDRLYSEARLEVVRAELFTELAAATGDPKFLLEQQTANRRFAAIVPEFRIKGPEDDRAFGVWAQQYITPMSLIFEKMTTDPSMPYETLMQEYSASYVALYESLRDPSVLERLGLPLNTFNTLVDPQTVGGDPRQLTNPVPIVMAAKADEARIEQAEALMDVQHAQELTARLRATLFALGGVLIMVLLAVILYFGRRESRIRTDMDLLERVATTDPLTGLGNRRGFEESTKRLNTVAGEPPVALLMIDLDEFKGVNDTFGHARGDAILTSFGSLLAAIAPPGAGRFRIGGDEFALILHGPEIQKAADLAENLRVQAKESLGNDVTVSIGIAVLNSREPDESLLRQQADAALYEAKLKGRNLVVLYHHDGQGAPLFPAAKMQAVRNLLVEGRIDAVFQPIWDMTKKKLLGYEGLSRPHSDYGLDGPQQAFDIAEQFGHAADLDRLCRQHILAAAVDLPPDVRLFVNLSPYSLTHNTFSPFMLLSELKVAGISASRIVFEITELSKVAPEVIAEAVELLRANNLAVAIDDVGSGNNGLELMRRAQFDYVKIDRGVMVSATKSGNGRAALMAILAFASESGAVVIAEGIEDVEMFDVVREVAHASLRGHSGLIHSVQGYYFGRPLPATMTKAEAPPTLVA